MNDLSWPSEEVVPFKRKKSTNGNELENNPRVNPCRELERDQLGKVGREVATKENQSTVGACEGGEACNSEMVESELTCCICSEVFLEPVSVLPCLHKFCSGCISQWITRNHRNCPLCRSGFNVICRDHLLELDSDAFLVKNPSKMRSQDEIAFLTSSNMINQDVVCFKKMKQENVISIYATDRAQALDFASVLVPLGVDPSDIYYRTTDSYGSPISITIERLE